METIYLCRHGQTTWNLEGRKQGHMDSPLTESGAEHAKKLGEFFRGQVGNLYSSPLGRAMTVAQIIAQANNSLGLTLDDRLKEISFGDLEGRTATEIGTLYPDLQLKYTADPFNFKYPNGESHRDLMLRVTSFIKSRQHDRQTIVIAHENTNRVFLGAVLSLPQADFMRIIHPHHLVYKIAGGNIETIDTEADITYPNRIIYE